MSKQADALLHILQNMSPAYHKKHGWIISFSNILDRVEKQQNAVNSDELTMFLQELAKQGHLELVYETFDCDLLNGIRLK